jgi:uncharacterized membrane protein
MKTRLVNVLEIVRTNFWFVPGVMILSAIGLSFLMVVVDRRIDAGAYSAFGLLYAGGPEGARSILSTIAGSMITVAGVAFSITIVALTLASSQFGPRLLRNFIRDTGNQVVLGTFISTFIYCLLVLRSVSGVGGQVSVPGISVTFAMLLALANVGVLIYFIHHVSTSIHVDRVIAEVYRELSGQIRVLFPEELGCEVDECQDEQKGRQRTEDEDYLCSDVVAARSGYVQAIDGESQFTIAETNDLRIHLRHRPGEFVVEGDPLCRVEAAEPLNVDLSRRIGSSFIIGKQRSPEQDAEFAVHQLVEVALRALSPGINDPFTAITCVDYLGSILCTLTSREFPRSRRYDSEGRLRITAKPLTFAGMMNAAFDQIRQCGSTNVAVTIRLLETLGTIAGHVQNSRQRQAILRQADMIARASQKSLPERDDRDDVQQRYQAVLRTLDEHAV